MQPLSPERLLYQQPTWLKVLEGPVPYATAFRRLGFSTRVGRHPALYKPLRKPDGHLIILGVHLQDDFVHSRDEQLAPPFAHQVHVVCAASREYLLDLSEILARLTPYGHANDLKVVVRALGQGIELMLRNGEETPAHSLGLGAVVDYIEA